ncbi:3868_t:CDS:2 [Funneliformis caledonium]|uniref:3868_t:CDS:1 n=1 Tax=Funneliformis caledonium TaxID=1117310 RepID=A0A9N9APU9_9GLOM|nr:3868_t:CDS:2 [Funneliformis caledonium]
MSDSDDYMSSKFLTEPPPEPSPSLTYSERRRQKKLSNKGYNKPRFELEKEHRDQALAKRIDTEENESPGLKILKKMGYEQGKGLGKDPSNIGRTEPLNIELKQDKLGLGMATEIKHKAQAELAKVAKRTRVEEDSFRERVRQEKLDKRVKGQLRKLQTICETLDTKHGIEDNIYWRHEETIDDELENNNDEDKILFEEQVVEDKEDQIEERKAKGFEGLEPREQLDCVLRYLREKYQYCFWCGCEYGSAEEMDQECPGYEEEDHD